MKTNGYTQTKKNNKRRIRQKEADLRQAKYDALSKAEKIQLINSRPGNSKAELDKVMKLK
jgi:hypothetical protein